MPNVITSSWTITRTADEIMRDLVVETPIEYSPAARVGEDEPPTGQAEPSHIRSAQRCGCGACREQILDEGFTVECQSCSREYTRRNVAYGNHEYCWSCMPCDPDDADEDEEYEPDRYVHNYSYRPTTNFRHVEDDPDAGSLYMGFELEVPTNEPEDVARLLYNTHGDRERLLYCKDDGSIDGTEIVSHPMTHAFFRTQFPDMLTNDAFKVLMRNRRPSVGYGLHIHVSRAGFQNEAHKLRWLLLIYRNQAEMELLARRTNDEWCSFVDSIECPEKARRDTWGGRYTAVNATNANTFEMRMFRSTLKPKELKAALDFAHASVKYTGELSAKQATRSGLNWSEFAAWVRRHDEYPSLVSELERISAAQEAAQEDSQDAASPSTDRLALAF